MRKECLYFCLCATLISLLGYSSVWAAKPQKKARVASVAVVKGVLPDYHGTGVAMLIDVDNPTASSDTLHPQSDGSFTVRVRCTKPLVRGLYLEYLGENRCVISCYLVPGSTTCVALKGAQKNMHIGQDTLSAYVYTPTFTGPTKRECDFLNIPQEYYDYKFTTPDGKPVTYKNYLSQLNARRDFLLGKLKGTRPDFAAAHRPAVYRMPELYKFIYAWQMSVRGFNADKDADFAAYVNSINVNDPKNLGDGFSTPNLTSDVVRYRLMTHPELYKGMNNQSRTFCYLRDHITNAKVRNTLADESMENILSEGGTKDLESTFAIYRSFASQSAGFKENEAVFINLTKLAPGTKATDFEMQDVDGKTVHFLDVIGKGKVVYIDFWATWCGPCCLEIPYVAEMVKKFAGNPNIEFVSISLDKDKDKWHKKLAEDKPSWRQFLIPDNFNSAFARQYNITAIPRFMLFDKEGKIINIAAPRPSEEGFEAMMKKLGE
jgi:thiol-disulfide isomerase/thioredoxin